MITTAIRRHCPTLKPLGPASELALLERLLAANETTLDPYEVR
jgi:hypothetical protein